MPSFINVVDLFHGFLSSSSNPEEFPEEIKNDFEYWIAREGSRNVDEESEEKFRKSTLENIRKYYLNNGIDTENVKYSEYAKYFDEEQPYLFEAIFNKAEVDDPGIPNFMCHMISFFDAISKLPEEEQKALLGQFPMSEENDYNCIPGIDQRLTIVDAQRFGPHIMTMNGVIESESGKLLKCVADELQAHVPAMLSFLACGESKDKNSHMPIKHIPAADVWSFAKKLPESLEDGFKSNFEISESINELRKIKDAYKNYVENKVITDLKINPDWLSETHIEDKSGLFTAFSNSFFSDFLLKECSFVGNNSGLINKFFDTKKYEKVRDRDAVEDIEFLTFKINEDGKTLLELKIEELEKKYEKIYLEDQASEVLSEYNLEECNLYDDDSVYDDEVYRIDQDNLEKSNLYDKDFPQKITNVLKDKDSTPHQKHLAVQALWIMSKPFVANSRVNFIKALYLIGQNKEKNLNPKDAIKNSRKIFLEMQSNHSISKSTRSLVNKIQECVKVVLKNDPCDDVINNNLDINQFIGYGLPLEILDNYDSNLLMKTLLQGQDKEAIANFILLSPRQDYFLKGLFSCFGTNLEECYKVLALLLENSLQTLDLTFCCKIINQSKEVSEELHKEVKRFIIDRHYKEVVNFDSNIIDLLVSDFESKEMIKTDLFISLIENNKLDIAGKIFSGLKRDEISDIIKDTTFINDLFFYESLKIINFFTVHIQKILGDSFSEWILEEGNGSLFFRAVKSCDLETVKFMLGVLQSKTGDGAKRLIFMQNPIKETPFRLALIKNNSDVIKLFYSFNLSKEEIKNQIMSLNGREHSLLDIAIKAKKNHLIKFIFETLESDQDFIKFIAESKSFPLNSLFESGDEDLIDEDLISLASQTLKKIESKELLMQILCVKNQNQNNLLHILIQNNRLEDIEHIFNIIDQKQIETIMEIPNSKGIKPTQLAIEWIDSEKGLNLDNPNSPNILSLICKKIGTETILKTLFEDCEDDMPNYFETLVKDNKIRSVKSCINLFGNEAKKIIKPKGSDYGLIVAIHYDRPEILDLMLEKLNKEDVLDLITSMTRRELEDMQSILFYAIRMDSVEPLQSIFKKLEPLEFSEIKDAIMIKSGEYKRTILHQVFNLNDDLQLGSKKAKFIVSILKASQGTQSEGDFKKEFLELMKIKDVEGNTPLHILLSKNNINLNDKLEVLKLVVENLDQDGLFELLKIENNESCTVFNGVSDGDIVDILKLETNGKTIIESLLLKPQEPQVRESRLLYQESLDMIFSLLSKCQGSQGSESKEYKESLNMIFFLIKEGKVNVTPDIIFSALGKRETKPNEANIAVEVLIIFLMSDYKKTTEFINKVFKEERLSKAVKEELKNIVESFTLFNPDKKYKLASKSNSDEAKTELEKSFERCYMVVKNFDKREAPNAKFAPRKLQDKSKKSNHNNGRT